MVTPTTYPTEAAFANALAALATTGTDGRTRDAYATDARQLGAWLWAHGLRSLAGVRREHLESWKAELRGQYRPASVNRKVSVARRVFQWAAEQDLVEGGPADRLRGVRADQDSGAPMLSLAEVRALLATCKGEKLPALRDRALLVLALHTGLRVSELVSLTWGDIGRTGGYTVLSVTGKGKKRRRVVLERPVVTALNRYRRALERAENVRSGFQEGRSAAFPSGLDRRASPIFQSLDRVGRGRRMRHVPTGRPMSRTDALRMLKRRLALAGVQTDASPHNLRATFATRALSAGADVYSVQYALGHASPVTTQRYDRMRERLERSPTKLVRY